MSPRGFAPGKEHRSEVQQDEEIRLCPISAGEIDIYAYWMTHGQWRQFDAPWESVGDRWKPEDLCRFKEGLLKTAARQSEAVSKCTLYLRDDPIGWVNSYRGSADHTSVKVGICICVDSCFGRGLGTRSLWLWVRHWFKERNLHRIGLDTWSFNRRMIRVAEKCGFIEEGVEREVQRWDGAWRDLHHFGMTEDDYARMMKHRKAIEREGIE